MGEMTSVNFSPEAKAGEGRKGSASSSSSLGSRSPGDEQDVQNRHKRGYHPYPCRVHEKGQSLDQHIDRLAMTAFEGRFDEQNRFILVTSNHTPLGRGRIIHGDGAIYQRVRFDALLFCMDDYEVVEGAISEVNEFGAFVRIGPMEALLHKSQILDDQVEVNVGAGTISGRNDDKRLGIGTAVRARIVSLSPDTSDPRRSKIGLTCKQPGLGSVSYKHHRAHETDYGIWGGGGGV